MSTNPKTLALASALLGVTVLGSACSAGKDAVAAPKISPEAANAKDLQAVKAATAKYASLEQAKADGYTGAGEPCVTSPGGGAPPGAMGFHYINPPLLGSDEIDPLRPEILLYAPGAGGKLRLVGVEYWKADADKSLATKDDMPTLFGEAFGDPMPGHSPTMPVHYDLHVWLHADNPAGMFAPFNPAISCPPAAS